MNLEVLERIDKMEPVNPDQLAVMMNHRPCTPDKVLGSLIISSKVIKANEDHVVVSMRNFITMGKHRPTNVTFQSPYKIRSLSEQKQGCWMTDSAQEVWQMKEPIEQCWGKVLVGGLGLGVFPQLLLDLNDKVDSVTVVEKNKNIIKLVADGLSPSIHIRKADLFRYLTFKSTPYFDVGFFDIWQMTGESAWYEYVLPLRRLARDKVGKVICWNEEEMLGQLRGSLAHTAYLKHERNVWEKHIPFFKAAVEAGVWKPVISMDNKNFDMLKGYALSESDLDVRRFVNQFLDVSGSHWEGMFGKYFTYPRKENKDEIQGQAS